MYRFHRVAFVTTAAMISALTFSTLPPIAYAGVNAGGVLLAHTNTAVVYTTDSSSYCGQSGLATCDAIVPETTGDAPAVIFVLAAFPTGALPRMSGTVFGIQYGSDVSVIAFGPCADFELRTTSWPASGEGTALAWNTPRTGLLSEVYWFAAYAYGGAEGELALAPHPTQGASFADDSVPSLLDPIADFGRFGFNQDGYAPCPSGNPIGGCCLPAGHCELLPYHDCLAQGGSYYGPDAPCSAEPCPPTGACCLGTQCEVITRVECEGSGGLYNGDGTACGGNICQIGACCVGIECSLVREAVCETLGGRFHGLGVQCEAIDCTVGACCIEGACFEKSPEDCESSGGVYQGIGTFCGFGQCVNTGCGNGIASGVPRNEAASVGLGQGALQLDPLTGTCGTLLLNTDSSYENGYAWQYGSVAPPYYGAFAECYRFFDTQICAAVFDLTQAGLDGGRMDIYVWDDDDGCPGNVLCGPSRVIPGTIAFWPNVSRHVFTLDGCCAESAVWVGYWGAWPGQFSPFYVGADLNGPGSRPKTCIAPGIGYPSGWNNVSIVFGPTQALGIGCETVPCTPPVAIEKMSWGRVKSLYDGAVRRVPATR